MPKMTERMFIENVLPSSKVLSEKLEKPAFSGALLDYRRALG